MSTAAALTASYTSPTLAQTFSSALPAVPTSGSVEDKTAFISAVRVSVSQMQDDVNNFLTQRMDEDKAQEAAFLGARTRTKDEEREEEMYGEEDVGEE